MLSTPHVPEVSRHAGRERRLWHDGERHTPSLGCMNCPDRGMCGGLNLRRALFDCLDLCCHNPEDCDAVCRRKPEEFAQRVREVGGFSLENVPRAPRLETPQLPTLVPMLFHGSRRVTPFSGPAVCLPLYSVIRRQNGSGLYESPAALAAKFAITPGASIILSGTDTDPPLERWWSLGVERREAIRALRGLGIALVTTPNYSLFTDQPRWDDLHSMKRIALVHEEFVKEGVSAALHLNARTERDWTRWATYIAAREEVTHVAFEFATGAGWAGRDTWHADQLARLAVTVGRPLHLVVRGGTNVLPTLVAAFANITVLETSTFIKSMKRQSASLADSGAVNWRPSPTAPGAPVDQLLLDNWSVVAEAFAPILSRPTRLASGR